MISLEAMAKKNQKYEGEPIYLGDDIPIVSVIRVNVAFFYTLTYLLSIKRKLLCICCEPRQNNR